MQQLQTANLSITSAKKQSDKCSRCGAHTAAAGYMTAVGFEPTPLRTGALSQRLRPLGQTVLVSEKLACKYQTHVLGVVQHAWIRLDQTITCVECRRVGDACCTTYHCTAFSAALICHSTDSSETKQKLSKATSLANVCV